MSTASEPESRLAHLREALDARIALAKIEVQHDIACSKRLGISAGAGAVIVIIGLTCLTLVFADYLAALTQTQPWSWRLAFGIVMTLAGGAAIYLSWRTFRREFSGLSETLDELREDQRWLADVASEILGASAAGPTTPEEPRPEGSA